MTSDKWQLMKLKNLRLKTKLVITYILLTVIPMALLGSIIYYQNTKAIEEEVGEYIPRLLKQANQNMENEIDNLENLPNLIYNSSDVMAVLRGNPYKDQSALLEDQFTVESFLSSTYLGQNNSEILGAFLLSNNRSFISTKLPYEGFDLADRSLPYGEGHALGENSQILLPNQIDLTFEGNPPFMVLVKEIQDFDNRNSLGTLFLAVKVTFIEKVLHELDEEEKATMWVMDEGGQVIYHTDQKRIGTNFEEINSFPLLNGSFRTKTGEEQMLISVSQSAQHQWVTVHSIPITYLTERTDTVKMWMIIIFGVLAVMTTFISVFLARTVTRPINVLGRLMKDVETGNFNVPIPIHSKDEVGVLASSFRSMIRKIKELINKNYQIELRQKNAELYALQSQINPHFMYNTLETIGAAIEDDEKDLVVDMIAILGRMLRFSLSNKDRLVSIAEEVNHIENYLTLQKFRFEERIWFEIHNEVGDHAHYTPKFVLQPIVENAVQYGMQYRKALKINICITYETVEPGRKNVLLRIQDNGPGIPASMLAAVQEKLQSDPMAKRDSGFGMVNVHARVVMMFGNPYGITVNSKEGEGTDVMIRIPVITEHEIAQYASKEEGESRHDNN